MRERAYSQKKKVIGNFCRSWPLKIEDISKSQNKYYRNDLMLNLKKKSNLSIRETAKILGINLRGITARIKV
ncbi:MAG: hypothetical protein MUP69_05995 [Candidatus Atribacteria bacterium]|jgi:hypothetical protein|nr:hypothetical protein [Candidatus Atribacteria bacterium]